MLFFDNNFFFSPWGAKKVPKMALTVGVGTIMDAREVVIIITGTSKAFALYKAVEEGK